MEELPADEQESVEGGQVIAQKLENELEALRWERRNGGAGSVGCAMGRPWLLC